MSRRPHRVVLSITLSMLAAALLAACSDVTSEHDAGVLALSSVGPEVIALPDGFAPEGITEGRGATAYVGSLRDGSIVRVDLRTGAVELAVPPQVDRMAVGLDYDDRSDLIWVAGGQGPDALGRTFIAETGEVFATLAPVEPTGFVNDVVVTRDAAWFTDSFLPVLYRVPLDGRGWPAADASVVPLSGDWTQGAGFNANGIVATPDGRTLFVVNSALGSIFAVDAETGEAAEVDLGGAGVTFGDGLLLDGPNLYVVQNALNQIAVVRILPDSSTGEVVGTITSPDFDIPTTVAEFGSHLFAVNARFNGPTGPDVEYDVVRVEKGPASR